MSQLFALIIAIITLIIALVSLSVFVNKRRGKKYRIRAKHTFDKNLARTCKPTYDTDYTETSAQETPTEGYYPPIYSTDEYVAMTDPAIYRSDGLVIDDKIKYGEIPFDALLTTPENTREEEISSISPAYTYKQYRAQGAAGRASPHRFSCR